MPPPSYEDELARLDKVIREAEDIIARQQELIRQVRETGLPTGETERTLETMTSSLEVLKQCRDYLLRARRPNLH